MNPKRKNKQKNLWKKTIKEFIKLTCLTDGIEARLDTIFVFTR